MDNKELLELLLTTGYPVAYGKHSTDKNCPYMDYVLLYSNNVFGGNRVRGLVNRWQVNLYTKGKNTSHERVVEDALTNAGLCWQKVEGELDKEGVLPIFYEFAEPESRDLGG